MDATTGAGLLTGAAAGVELVRRFVYKPCRAAVTRVTSTFDQVDMMAKALGPNGGASLSDKISRVDTHTGRTNELMQITSGRVDRLVDWIERPIYETDDEGRLTRPNEALCKLVGLSADQLLGMGWVSLIADVDRERVMREIGWARRDRRSYRVRAVIETAAGKRLEVLMVAQPKADGETGDILAYFGAIEVLQVLEAKAS